ncbi:TPA: host cell division inhibitor Icd-like protein [Salmonella enterica]|nr:host cell division inhibitor Icd-like protein [Salmonella enterica]
MNTGGTPLQRFTGFCLMMWRLPTMRNNRPCFVWRFVSGQNATYTTTAASEREARSRLPAGRLVFAARIRVNGGATCITSNR